LLSGAADALNFTQSAVSKQIAQLASDLDRRIEMQVEAIEAGVGAALVRAQSTSSRRSGGNSKARSPRRSASAMTTGSSTSTRHAGCSTASPGSTGALAEAGPELRRSVFEAFRLSAAIDRNAGQIRLKAVVSSAFGKAGDLQELVANGTISGTGFEPATSITQSLLEPRPPLPT
jgi:hypothetical protein